MGELAKEELRTLGGFDETGVEAGSAKAQARIIFVR